jgi:hypothetical protein
MSKYFVTMTDKFMSGWGHARGKINKLIFICDSYDQALIVEENARNRSDQKNINICSKRPYYSSNTHFTQVKTIEEYPSWYVQGHFRKQA